MGRPKGSVNKGNQKQERSGGRETREYNDTICPMKKRKYNYTWFVDADIKDRLENVKVGDLLVLKILREDSIKNPGTSPEAYLEVMPKARADALRGNRDRDSDSNEDSGSSEDDV